MSPPMLEALLEGWRGKRVVVLGGSGVIGSRLVEVLAAAPEAEVTVVVRRLARAVRIARYPVRLVQGDVADAALLERCMEGSDVVLDLTFPKAGERRERCEEARRMARTIGAAVSSQGVRRLVHLSTISVYGRPAGNRLDEDSPREPGSDPYGLSKLVGEREMLRLHRESGLPVVVLQPTIVYGPFTGWSLGPLGQLKRGRFVLPDEGGGCCNAVYLDDVVQAILRAGVVEGVEGQVFLISGASAVTWREFYGAYEEMLGEQSTTSMSEPEILRSLARRARENRPVRRLLSTLRRDAGLRQLVLRLPVVAQGYAVAQRLVPRSRLDRFKARVRDRGPSGVAGVKPLLFPTSAQLGIYASSAEVSIERARKRLGYSPDFDLERGMARTRAWASWARVL